MVSDRAGTEVTMASVKRALQEGRIKMQVALNRRGLGPRGGK
jgi:RNA 3'-terminal phosphate cyclase